MRKGFLLVFVLLLTLISCGGLDVSAVKNGYLDGFGYEVTVGEAFDVLSDNTVKWTASTLDDERYPSNLYYLVEASWEVDASDLIVQFAVDKEEDSFSLHGALIDGEYYEPLPVIYEFVNQYNEIVGY